MRYHAKKPQIIMKIYGKVYICNHPLYKSGTLFQIKDKGLVLIQQYFNEEEKTTWWGPIEPWVANKIYLHKDFKSFFNTYSEILHENMYPTITVRHAMYWLKMKPLEKPNWETVFDRVFI